MKRRILQSTLVTVLAVILTTFGIDAADTLQNRGGTLLSQVITSQDAECPEGMTVLTLREKRLCVDVFEVSPGEVCPQPDVRSPLDTTANKDVPGCVPVAEDGKLPWTHVTFNEAYELCARAGKRLPTNEEWYGLAAGTPDSIESPVCNTKGGSLLVNDARTRCVTGNGIHNAIGNAWEWVDAEVRDGTLDGMTLPPSGYVTAVNREGIAEKTESVPSEQYSRDYLWSEPQGEFGLLRGGFFGSGDDAGLYGVQAKTPLSFSSAAIGFRCVDDIS